MVADSLSSPCSFRFSFRRPPCYIWSVSRRLTAIAVGLVIANDAVLLACTTKLHVATPLDAVALVGGIGLQYVVAMLIVQWSYLAYQWLHDWRDQPVAPPGPSPASAPETAARRHIRLVPRGRSTSVDPPA